MKRDKLISVRIGGKDLEEIDSAASKAGCSRSTYMIESSIGRARGVVDVIDMDPVEALRVLQTKLGMEQRD